MIRLLRKEVDCAVRYAQAQRNWVGDAVSEAIRDEEDAVRFDVDLLTQAHEEMRHVCRVIDALARRVEELEGLR